MAAPVTHIKFALDVKEYFSVQNLDEYLAGSVYPDSRYVSGVDRDVTHGDFLLAPSFWKTDFKKGWATHHLCDVVGQQLILDLFFNLFEDVYDADSDEELGVRVAAIKFLLDLYVFETFQMLEYSPFSYRDNPCGEDMESMHAYYNTLEKAYAKEDLSIGYVLRVWKDRKMEHFAADRILEKTKQYYSDEVVFGKMEELYKKLLAQSLERLNGKK